MHILSTYRKWVGRLRTQPPGVKSHVALIGAVVVTTVIGAVWATTLPARFSQVSTASDALREDLISTSENLTDENPAAVLPSTPREVPERTPDTRSEEERLRARVDALMVGLSGDPERTPAEELPPTTTRPTFESTPGAPVLIEAR